MIKSQKVTLLKLVCSLVMLGILVNPVLIRAAGKKAGQTGSKFETPAIKWTMEAGPGANLKLVAPNKQFFRLDNQINLALIDNGKINVYQYNDETQWTQGQTLEVPEVAFTTLVVKDLNDDQIPEIIGGTTEPGFIYIYYRDLDGKWVTKNDAKYIWSTVAKLTTVCFDVNSPPVLVIQNKEGFLFVLKPSETAVDLIWKSPAAWQPFENLVAVDADHAGGDELLAVYKKGGVAILRSVKNALISEWKYFPWGKVLSVNQQDWDNNKTSEIILPTTRKMVCVIKSQNKKFTASQEAFEYMIEKMYFGKFQNQNIRLTTDTSGKTHIAEYVAKSARHWKETQILSTGRILDFFEEGPDEIILINQSLQLIRLKITFDVPEFSNTPRNL
jgi:hypothetical protein